MPLDEALAICLFWQHAAPGSRDDAIYQLAWETVVKEAMQAIDRIKYPDLAKTR